jgi:hypothetical protein
MRAAFITGYGGNSVVRVAGKGQQLHGTMSWHSAKDHYVHKKWRKKNESI